MEHPARTPVQDAEAPEAGFDAYTGDYVRLVEESIRFSGQNHEALTRRKALHLRDVATRHVGRPHTLEALDVGCGIGLIDRHLHASFGRLAATDTSESAIAVATERNPPVEYRTQHGARLPFEDASFDLAFAICVLHHVPPKDRPAFSQELRRVVRPNGLVVIIEHNPLNPLTRIAVSGCEFDKGVVLSPRRATRRLLAQAGLRTVEARFITLLPSERPRAMAIERAFAGVPIGAQYYVAGTPI